MWSQLAVEQRNTSQAYRHSSQRLGGVLVRVSVAVVNTMTRANSGGGGLLDLHFHVSSITQGSQDRK